MRKHFLLILAVTLFACLVMLLTGCEGNDDNKNDNVGDVIQTPSNESTNDNSNNSTTDNNNETSRPSHVCSFSDWTTMKYPTCVDKGVEQRYCTLCSYTESRPINTVEHILGVWVTDKEPSCTQKGLMKQVCLVCENTIATETLDSKGHTNGEWIVDYLPTANESGSKHQICLVCKDVIKIEIIPANPSGLEFELNSDGESYSVIGIGTCSGGDIVVPETYNQKPVTKIASYAFMDCSSLISISIPNSITNIEYFAFSRCISLESVIIGNGVKSIETSAFENCKALNSVILGNCIESIGYCAFKNCTSLKNLILPDSVTTIGASAFYYCTSLESIIIPSNVTSIGDNAFWCCYPLTIYCKAKTWPSGWAYSWNQIYIDKKATVIWGYT